jgi:hypothetical protein
VIRSSFSASVETSAESVSLSVSSLTSGSRLESHCESVETLLMVEKGDEREGGTSERASRESLPQETSSSCLTRLPLRVLAEMDPSRGFMRLSVCFFTSRSSHPSEGNQRRQRSRGERLLSLLSRQSCHAPADLLGSIICSRTIASRRRWAWTELRGEDLLRLSSKLD